MGKRPTIQRYEKIHFNQQYGSRKNIRDYIGQKALITAIPFLVIFFIVYITIIYFQATKYNF